MNYKNNILELIGDTPLVKLHKLTKGLKPLVLAGILFVWLIAGGFVVNRGVDLLFARAPV